MSGRTTLFARGRLSRMHLDGYRKVTCGKSVKESLWVVVGS